SAVSLVTPPAQGAAAPASPRSVAAPTNPQGPKKKIEPPIMAAQAITRRGKRERNRTPILPMLGAGSIRTNPGFVNRLVPFPACRKGTVLRSSLRPEACTSSTAARGNSNCFSVSAEFDIWYSGCFGLDRGAYEAASSLHLLVPRAQQLGTVYRIGLLLTVSP